MHLRLFKDMGLIRADSGSVYIQRSRYLPPSSAVSCHRGISEKKYDLQLAAGIYLLKAGDGNNVSTVKLVVRD